MMTARRPENLFHDHGGQLCMRELRDIERDIVAMLAEVTARPAG